MSGEACAGRVRSGALGPVAFRAGWEGLGFERNGEGAGTPADDYLDGLLHLSRHAAFVTPTGFGLLNLATRAARVADFLRVTEPARASMYRRSRSKNCRASAECRSAIKSWSAAWSSLMA